MKPIKHQIRNLYILQIISALLGTALSLYLLVHHTRVKLGIQDSSSFCSFGRLADCDIVNVSKFSEIAGFPLASLGAIYFFLILVLGVFVPPQNLNFRLVRRVMAWLGSLAFLIDLVLLIGVQWLTLGSFCLMCILTYVANLLHLGANFKITKLEQSSHVVQNFFWGREPWSFKKFSTSRFVMSLLSLTAFSGLVIALPSWIELNSGQPIRQKEASSNFLSTWSQIPPKNIPFATNEAIYGNPNAKIKIVIFSDFQCPFCKKTAFNLHTLLPSFKNEILMVFKNFPLDKSCNPLVEHNMHPYACSLARLAVCAKNKGKFWDYHDQVFMHIEEQELEGGWDLIRKKLSSTFKDSEIDTCLRSESSLSEVQKDIELGIQLGIGGTPALFINGKSVSISLDSDTMKKIISVEDPQK